MKSAIAVYFLAGSGVVIGGATHPDPTSSMWWVIGAVAILLASVRIVLTFASRQAHSTRSESLQNPDGSNR